MARPLTVVAGGVALVAVIAWAASELVGSDDATTSTSKAGGDSVRELSTSEERTFEVTALDDEVVREMTRGSEVTVSEVIPWRDFGGGPSMGASVELRVDPQIPSMHQTLPIYVKPNEDAPEDTPPLHRHLRYKAKNVGTLSVLVTRDPVAVVEISPGGAELQTIEAQLLGPPPGDEYRPEPGR